MRPFNLERALAGDPVVTRNGENVEQLTYFKNTAIPHRLAGIVSGELYWWKLNGTEGGYGKGHDLFMAPRKITKWVCIYNTIQQGYYIGSFHQNQLFDSEEEAKKSIGNYHSAFLVKIVPISWEE